jgi:PHD/YefM family antitoxin component YafN of YafNO toxin-antitoxin module
MITMTHDKLKELLGVNELLIVTREQVEQELDSILDLIDTGHSPILITADGKPDLLMFSWSDYKRRFSILYPPEELERVEEEMQRQKETQ